MTELYYPQSLSETGETVKMKEETYKKYPMMYMEDCGRTDIRLRGSTENDSAVVLSVSLLFGENIWEGDVFAEAKNLIDNVPDWLLLKIAKGQKEQRNELKEIMQRNTGALKNSDENVKLLREMYLR